ncbi:hypothetical protein GCM10022222_51010 [Amycolatopsis ultiminotia]|uniref:HTH tetR-type domain-containing protein n=1 Tax=Amycolatopsis ultiminotia TaxID=543629 RepID=A0ABP6X689_9PSEU
MRDQILRAARELLTADAPTSLPPITLDEIAAQAGISRSQLRAYYTSIDAIQHDLREDHPGGRA